MVCISFGLQLRGPPEWPLLCRLHTTLVTLLTLKVLADEAALVRNQFVPPSRRLLFS